MDYNLKRVTQTDQVIIEGRKYRVEIWNHPDKSKTYDFIDISEFMDRHFYNVSPERLDKGLRTGKIRII